MGRTVAPDANPYLTFFSIFKAGLEGPMNEVLDSESRRTRTRFLPDNIYDGMRHFKGSSFMKEVLGAANHEKFLDRNQAAECGCQLTQ